MKLKIHNLKNKFFKLDKKKRIIISIFAVYLLLTPIVLFALGQKGNSNVLGTKSEDEEQLNVVEQVRLLAELPNEEPLVSTIENSGSLREQIFFKKAQDGDILLIFKENKRGVIYRPSSNQIIENTTIDVVAESKPTPVVTETNNPNYQQILNSNEKNLLTPTLSPSQVNDSN